MKYIMAVLISMTFVPFAGATETVPTAEAVHSTKQKKTHDKVAASQKKLKQKLKKNAPADELGEAKEQVQKDRVDANRADAVQPSKEATPAKK